MDLTLSLQSHFRYRLAQGFLKDSAPQFPCLASRSGLLFPIDLKDLACFLFFIVRSFCLYFDLGLKVT